MIISDFRCMLLSSNKPDDNKVVVVSHNLMMITGRQPLTRTRTVKAVWSNRQSLRSVRAYTTVIELRTTVVAVSDIHTYVYISIATVMNNTVYTSQHMLAGLIEL